MSRGYSQLVTAIDFETKNICNFYFLTTPGKKNYTLSGGVSDNFRTEPLEELLRKKREGSGEENEQQQTSSFPSVIL